MLLYEDVIDAILFENTTVDAYGKLRTAEGESHPIDYFLMRYRKIRSEIKDTCWEG